jgi:hypothetical protein
MCSFCSSASCLMLSQMKAAPMRSKAIFAVTSTEPASQQSIRRINMKENKKIQRIKLPTFFRGLWVAMEIHRCAIRSLHNDPTDANHQFEFEKIISYNLSLAPSLGN